MLGQSGEYRTALIIGNANYAAVSPLQDPRNDAQSMAAALRRLGFVVILREDATKQQMDEALRKFGDILAQRRRGTGLFYYSGHGMQVDGENFLIPIDARLERRDEIKYQTVYAQQVLDKMQDAGSRLNIVILDACRTNPFRSFSRAVGGGLAQMSAARGSIIAYATAPNTTASDGDSMSGNGLYTAQLLRVIQTPGLPVEMAFKKVTELVDAVSEGRQTPWYQSSIIGSFAFAPRASTESAPHASSGTPNPMNLNLPPTSQNLRWRDIQEGTGGSPVPGRRVQIHYVGMLRDGRKFDSSYDRGHPFTFIIGRGQVIKGLEQGILSMKAGGKRRLLIPSRLGYGENGAGPVPPNEDLYYEVELLAAEQVDPAQKFGEDLGRLLGDVIRSSSR